MPRAARCDTGPCRLRPLRESGGPARRRWVLLHTQRSTASGLFASPTARSRLDQPSWRSPLERTLTRPAAGLSQGRGGLAGLSLDARWWTSPERAGGSLGPRARTGTEIVGLEARTACG